jgi:hypothetical protein
MMRRSHGRLQLLLTLTRSPGTSIRKSTFVHTPSRLTSTSLAYAVNCIQTTCVNNSVSLCVSHETKFHMGYLLDLHISVSHETKVHMWYFLWDLHRSVSYLSNGKLGPATVEDGNSSSNEHNGEEKSSHKQVGKPEPDGVDEDLVHFEQSEHLFDDRFPERLGPKWNLIWTKCLQSRFSNLCRESLRDLKFRSIIMTWVMVIMSRDTKIHTCQINGYSRYL